MANENTGTVTERDMYTLQMRRKSDRKLGNAGWGVEYATNSVRELKDRANLQNTDYRIVDHAGLCVWNFQA